MIDPNAKARTVALKAKGNDSVETNDGVRPMADDTQKANEAIGTPAVPVGKKTAAGSDSGEPPKAGKYQVLSPSDPTRSASAFLVKRYTREGIRTLRHYAGLLMEWRDNCYREKEEDGLRAELYDFLGGAYRTVKNAKDKSNDEEALVPFQPTARKVDLVLDALKALIHLGASVTPPVWLADDSELPPAVALLPCQSCVLHLPSMETFPPTPALFVTNALPVDYDPKAAEPKQWHNFLRQLWPDDPESITALQQWCGYFLTADTRQQKMLLLVGPRRSGKGTIGRVLGAMLGGANVVSPTTSGLCTQFGLQSLIGKSLAIVSDARFTGLSNGSIIVERLLSISGEDALTINRKYLTAVTMKLPTRFMFLTNEVPSLADASGALAGRFIVLRLTKSFYDEEDMELTDKLLTELPGILKWAVEGWQQLQGKGRFVQPESARETVRDLQDLGSPVREFIDDRCVLEPGYRITKQALYDAWCKWCAGHGRDRPGTDATFGRNLMAAVPGLGTTRPGSPSGTRSRCYEGISLRITD